MDDPTCVVETYQSISDTNGVSILFLSDKKTLLNM